MITGIPDALKPVEPLAEPDTHDLIEAGDVPTEQLEAEIAPEAEITPEATRRDLGHRVIVLQSGQFKGDHRRVFGHPAQQEKAAQDFAAMTGYYVPPRQQ